MKKCIVILFIAAFTAMGCSKNTMPADTMPVGQVIGSKDFVFRAETANPVGGSAVRLSYGYDLLIKPGEVIATLPYFGRAYTADRNFNGMRFTSKQYKYNATSDNEANWEIVIEPEDVQDVQALRLSITAGGYATLHITSNSRQPISYYGRIQKM